MRRTPLLALAAVAALAIAPAADAAKKKTHKVMVHATILSHAVGPNGPDAGSVSDPVLGNGATVYTSTGGMTQTVTFQAWFDLGSIKGTGTVTLGTAANGQTPFTGTGNVTGGTAKYKGAKGPITFTGYIETGTTPTNGTGIVHITVTGALTYKG